MEADICKAISNRLVIEFKYKGSVRAVEPHTLGHNHKGNCTLCGWQRAGGSGEDFRDFHLAEMSALQLTNTTFGGPRPGYRRGSDKLDRIVCEL